MTCDNCGSLVTHDESACPQCRYEAPTPTPAKKTAKVVPFRPRKKNRHPLPPKGRIAGGKTFWWFIAILAGALILPYVVRMHP
jgi:uncharacterized membrane protein YvbJ